MQLQKSIDGVLLAFSLRLGYAASMSKIALKTRLGALSTQSTLRLTTIGRNTGRRHTVTVWFLVDSGTVYLVTLKLKRDWPRNVIKNGAVELDIAGNVFNGHAKPITNAKQVGRVKTLLSRKYWAAWVGSWFGAGPEGVFAVTIEE